MNVPAFLIILLAPLLAVLSGFYTLGLQIDRLLKTLRRKKLPLPVISIGNLTVGGTGKTPLLIRLIADLQKNGHQPVVLTRGYKGAELTAGDRYEGNDETQLLRARFPNLVVAVGADRFTQAQKWLNIGTPSLFLLDDGFQHWMLERNFDFVCVDATNPWGNSHLLPWGRLREPLSALKRADVVVITRCELATRDALEKLQKQIARYVPLERIFLSKNEFTLIDYQGRLMSFVNNLDGKKVIAVSGIGNPTAYHDNLKQWGVTPIAINFPDHHTYNDADLDGIERQANEQQLAVVVTEKDWMKLRTTRWLSHPPAFGLIILRMELAFDAASEERWQSLLKKSWAKFT